MNCDSNQGCRPTIASATGLPSGPTTFPSIGERTRAGGNGRVPLRLVPDAKLPVVAFPPDAYGDRSLPASGGAIEKTNRGRAPPRHDLHLVNVLRRCHSRRKAISSNARSRRRHNLDRSLARRKRQLEPAVVVGLGLGGQKCAVGPFVKVIAITGRVDYGEPGDALAILLAENPAGNGLPTGQLNSHVHLGLIGRRRNDPHSAQIGTALLSAGENAVQRLGHVGKGEATRAVADSVCINRFDKPAIGIGGRRAIGIDVDSRQRLARVGSHDRADDALGRLQHGGKRSGVYRQEAQLHVASRCFFRSTDLRLRLLGSQREHPARVRDPDAANQAAAAAGEEDRPR